MTNKYSYSGDVVKVCSKDKCIEAKGKNAEMIAVSASIMLFLIGIAALINASR